MLVGNYIGGFNVESGQIVITDPCYNKDDLTLGQVLPAINGMWEMYVSIVDDNVDSVLFINKDYSSREYIKDYNFKTVGFIIVESGRLTVCDYEKYEDTPDEYEKYCNQTSSVTLSGIVENYAGVTSTGFGDGKYSINGATLNDKYYAINVDFINIEDDKEDDDFAE